MDYGKLWSLLIFYFFGMSIMVFFYKLEVIIEDIFIRGIYYKFIN